MSTEVYLIRHGETIWNKAGRFQGCTDIDLSEDGIKQANHLKEALKHKFDVIYASPLRRAYDTAVILGESNGGLLPIIEDDIKEINFGTWEGFTFHEIKEKYPEEFNAFRSDEGKLMGGDLTLEKVIIRATEAIRKLVEANQGKKIAIVAHGGIIKAALIGLFDWKITMYHHFYLGNTSITRLSFVTPSNPLLIGFNDMHHLPGHTL
ncbi:phosphoglycerate mutase [Anaerocolumna cellulosilytica]|uniref:Phosphoglycerate mutase n=1 Tax=Anaerocolumna cellulosilytica TaxID=433286 RepID=A0A6S6R9E3_9FIRM|nr:histidine phosphatase family protein [Anaerocolumna cellulosilytica]MBB5195093.1 putative phosphoglycerate mutase [Anaerocolumna cellulosilytica]BCJ96070.1 phosphoglycerate mutase [Anaerocolumna cellulosilytica]